MMLIVTIAVLSAILSRVHSAADNLKLQAFLNRSRTSLLSSTWPIDHGDTARSKFTMSAGLPKDVSAERIKFIENTEIGSNIQWLYTGGKNSEYVLILGSNPKPFVAKLNATSLEFLQMRKLYSNAYFGGMVMHKNGHVYAVWANILYTFWDGNLDNATVVKVPTNLNQNYVLTNGMSVTQDGYLVVKQWAINAGDLPLMLCAKYFFLRKLFVAMTIIFTTIAFRYILPSHVYDKQQNKRGNQSSFVIRLAISLGFGAILSLLMTASIFFIGMEVFVGGFNLVRFFLEGTISPNHGGGELKIIDPLTLQVVAHTELCMIDAPTLECL
jgi:hypothetical protein